MRVANYFILNKNKIVTDPEKAEIIILFTCGFTDIKEKENIKVIEEFKKKKGELIILGCLPAIASQNLKKVFNGKVLSSKNLDKIDNFFPEFKIRFVDVPDANIIYNSEHYNKGKQAILRIANGCFGHCTFCAIRFATGKLRSKPLKDIINEYKCLLERGFKKFIINAEDCGFYGIDIGYTLSELLEHLSSIDHNYRVEWFIQTINPQYAIKNKEILIKYIQQGKISKIKCDIQSGNERILQLMKRFSNIDAILNLFSEFKKSNTSLYIISQFIIGFPSETEDEFQNTLELMNKLSLDQYEIFRYSERKGTVTSKIKGKVQMNKIEKRIKKLKDYFEKNGYDSSTELNKIYLYKKSSG